MITRHHKITRHALPALALAALVAFASPHETHAAPPPNAAPAAENKPNPVNPAKPKPGSFRVGGYPESQVFLRTAAIVIDGPSLLDAAIGKALLERLQKSKRFESITLHPVGVIDPPGARLPDLLIRLEARNTTVTDSLCKTDLVMDTGNWHLRSQFGTGVHLAPYTIETDCVIPIECPSPSSQTADQRNQALAAKAADAAHAKVIDVLQFISKHTITPVAPPPEILPAYTQIPDFAFIRNSQARLLSSGTTFATPNITTWEIPSATVDPKIVADALKEMYDRGWGGSDQTGGPPRGQKRFWAHGGNQMFMITWGEEKPVLEANYETREICRIIYMRQISKSAAIAALAKLIKREAIEGELHYLQLYWSEQRESLDALFAKRPPQSQFTLTWLIDNHIKAKKPELAQPLLRRADTLYRLEHAGTQPAAHHAATAQTLGITLPEIPDLALLAPGEHLFTSRDLPTTRTVSLNAGLILVRHAADGYIKIQRISPIADPENPTKFIFKATRNSFRKGTASTNTQTLGDPTGASGPLTLAIDPEEPPVVITSKPIPGTQTFELHIAPTAPAK